MLRDLAIVLMAAGATLIATGGSWALIRWMRRRPWVDVLDMVEAPPVPRTGSGVKPPQVVMPLRCICTARRSFCECAIDGVRNPRGAGRGSGVTLDPDERMYPNGARVRLEGRWP